ncbi:MAG: DUF3179 domain-containing protein, partial [Candidatus Omnitrophica bacterium]|nr:DUF3179 domain-containing protein [Candidatus Omnitrophota bacterium]
PQEIITDFLNLVDGTASAKEAALTNIEDYWEPGFVPMVIESIYMSRDTWSNARLIEILRDRTGQRFGSDLDDWYVWLWSQNYIPHPQYADFKSRLYRRIDPRFATYFSNDRPATIRLDEVRWGGVRQDGIPPLRSPQMIEVQDADYLQEDNVVFGIEINGDARAYPKRILAWHEMFVDTVGGESVTGAYCTLCGSMILYRNTLGNTRYQMGTSGFLFRSNKLMYDKKTQSLWNTLWGEPVIGPLVGKGIQLEKLSVVTTTWAEWRRRHPNTTVLSPNTGHRRDYAEGAAYRSYFGSDALMFTVPELDHRLKNKDEIFGMVLPQAPDKPLAVASRFLRAHPVHHDRIGDDNFVIFTDTSGAHRAYESKDLTFISWDNDRTARDASGTAWTLTENYLESKDGERLYRLPAHNAFWFGWFAAYKNTRLVM